MAKLPFTFTGVPDVAPLYEYTLTINGGKPNSQATPYYLYENQWLPLFDPNVIPYIELDANGEAVHVFKGDAYFMTATIKVEGELPEEPPTENGFNPMMQIMVVVCVFILLMMLGGTLK